MGPAEEGLLLPPHCDTEDFCPHLVIAHKDHLGRLVDGLLYCQEEKEGPLKLHHLDSLDQGGTDCSLIEPVHGHAHGPGCGHERIRHDDHLDWLVGEELHHVLEGDSCCSRGCMGKLKLTKGATILHGHVSIIPHRGGKGSAGDALLAEPLLASDTVEVRVDSSAVAMKEIITKIYAGGICCPSEVPLVHRILTPLPGVLKVQVAVVTKTVIVTHLEGLTSPAALAAALDSGQLDASLTPPRQQLQLRRTWLPPVPVLISGALLAISLIHYLAGPVGVPALYELRWIALGSVAIGLPAIALKGFVALRNRILDINFLMVVAVAGALALQQFEEAAAVVVLFGIAGFLEDRCSLAARDAIAAVLALKPEFAILSPSGKEVPVGDVEVGTLIQVKPGEKVPIDGQVVMGSSRLDQSMLTGEAAPLKRGVGDEVLGGTFNCGSGCLEVRTTALAADSAVARMAALVDAATSQQSPMEQFVTKFACWYTPLVVVACLCLALIPLAARVPDPKWWVYLALQLLVTACPCALVLSTPVTVVAALGASARQGVLVKGGQFMEALGLARIVSFDKTGTLTQGRFKVVHTEAYTGTVKELLGLAGSVEQCSNHPLAAAVVGAAAAMGAATDISLSSAHNVPGQGMEADMGGEQVLVGNTRMLEEQGVAHDAEASAAFETSWGRKGATVVWVCRNKAVVGVLCVADSPRPEARQAVAALHAAGVTTVMLTGDTPSSGAHVAEAVGIHSCHGGLLPEDKLALVKSYRERYGVIVHVGDGINDAPALAAADVGIAMGAAGAAVAVEAADVTLFTNDLGCLESLIRLGVRVRRTILQNIGLAVGTKVIVLVLAALGKFSLWGAVLVDVGTALAVVGNGMLLLRWRRHPSNGPAHSHPHSHTGSGCCKREEKLPLMDCHSAHEGSCCAAAMPHSGKGSCCAATLPRSEKGSCCAAAVPHADAGCGAAVDCHGGQCGEPHAHGRVSHAEKASCCSAAPRAGEGCGVLGVSHRGQCGEPHAHGTHSHVEHAVHKQCRQSHSHTHGTFSHSEKAPCGNQCGGSRTRDCGVDTGGNPSQGHTRSRGGHVCSDHRHAPAEIGGCSGGKVGHSHQRHGHAVATGHDHGHGFPDSHDDGHGSPQSHGHGHGSPHLHTHEHSSPHHGGARLPSTPGGATRRIGPPGTPTGAGAVPSKTALQEMSLTFASSWANSQSGATSCGQLNSQVTPQGATSCCQPSTRVAPSPQGPGLQMANWENGPPGCADSDPGSCGTHVQDSAGSVSSQSWPAHAHKHSCCGDDASGHVCGERQHGTTSQNEPSTCANGTGHTHAGSRASESACESVKVGEACAAALRPTEGEARAGAFGLNPVNLEKVTSQGTATGSSHGHGKKCCGHTH